MKVDFAACLIAQLEAHASMQPQDVVKMCYQAAFGAEHLLSDPAAARRYFDEEYARTAADASLPLTEDLSDAVCRVNLAAWKAAGLSAERLFDRFAASACIVGDGCERMEAHLRIAEALVEEGRANFSAEAWRDYLRDYRSGGMPPVHHSEVYRRAEHPAYRIVRREAERPPRNG